MKRVLRLCNKKKNMQLVEILMKLINHFRKTENRRYTIGNEEIEQKR